MKDELLIQEDYVHFYNLNRVYSMSTHFNILIGGRGIGKTTALKIRAVKNALNKDEEFIYVRRYKSETKKLKNLLDDIIGGVKCVGMGDSGCYKYKYKDKILGYCLPLTAQQTLKSVVFDKVTLIIYDEAIIKRDGLHHYLEDEVQVLLELVSTVVRLRDNYKVFVVGNNADIVNPYFEYFNVPRFEKTYVDNARSLFVENCPNKKELLQLEENTALYALTKGTPYGEYHYNNSVLVSQPHKVETKPMHCVLWYRMCYNNKTFVFWLWRENPHSEKGDFHCWIECKEGIIGDNPYRYIINDKPNYSFIREYKNSNKYRLLRDLFYMGYLSYDTEMTGEVVSEIIDTLK